ncbi:hypothetical protein O181_088331 [Austropuccinia psidii MF-1]|uniref:Uncharacterized protein n=1 Tax=Austropuccinia psidii MF-1 TaxID=1389203 RepID=A0A9Q3P6V4_9BASI|nr:hypothetical protein [Austropuccinia psidii MF-1]
MPDSKDTSMDDFNIILQADKQAEIFQRFINLAEKIKLRLQNDGANFNLWSKNMIITWTTYFIGDPNYFQQTTADDNIKRNLITRIFIEHSVDNAVYEAVTSRILNSDAHQIYQALKDRFNRPSWSSVVFHASSIFKNSLD